MTRLTDQQRIDRAVPESAVLRTALDILAARGVYAWRNNSGSFTDQRGQFVRFGKVGSSDILGIGSNGKLWAIEVKKETGKLSPDQEQFLAEVRARGGIALVVRPSNIDAAIAAALEGAST